MTQNEKVLRHLRTFGGIDPMTALQEYSIMRLGARIYDLKRAGVAIRTTTVRGKNRFGEATSYARYDLEEEHDAQSH